jgi:hypothetical protein
MKIFDFKRLRIEDYQEEMRPLIEKLAFPINDGFQTLYQALTKRLTFSENIASTINEFVVSVDSSGTPRNNIFIKLTNDLPVEGIQVIKVTPLDGVFPSSGLGITWSQTTKQRINGIIINNIQGLPANKNFAIKVLVIN